MLALWLASAQAAPVAPYLGLEWRPLSRGDLGWVLGGNTTGTQVGSLDGFVAPNLAAYGGAWLTDHLGVTGALGIARLQTTTWVEDVYVQRHWGVIRPALDLRFSLLPHDDPRPVPFLVGGVHVDVPSARDVSNGYTQEEQQAADLTATAERARLGGFGGRLGIGATVGVVPGLSLGAQYAVAWHRSSFLGDDPTAITSWLTGEASLLLQLDWK